MTGVHPLSSGIWGFGNALKQETFINTKSIPEYMRENGYMVFQSGKVFHSNPKMFGMTKEFQQIMDLLLTMEIRL